MTSVAKKELFAGRFKHAHEAAQLALREDPRDFDAVLVMAAIAIEHDNAPGANRLCQLLDEAGHESCWLRVLQGRVALLRQDQESARKLARSGCRIGTEDPHIASQLGVLLSRTGNHADAVEPMRLAVDAFPENTDYRHNFAVALQFAGDLAQAEEQFASVVKREPSHAKAWLALVQLAKCPGSDWESELEAQFLSSSNPEDRLLFGHAQARLAETHGEWDKSFAWLERAKEVKRAEVSHDRAATERMVEAAIAAASDLVIADAPDGDDRPIFVVGMPRSGTTLVERILTSHSKVTSVGELSDFAIVLKHTLATPGQFVLDAETLKAAAKAADLRSVGEEYLQRASLLAGDHERFIDKMPFNAFYAAAILRALPGAQVICLRRSPFDVLFANYRQLFATGFSYYSYNYDFGDTAHFVAHFERMAQAYEECLTSGRFLAVRYEDVIADQRGKTEQLLEFCGLDWEEACMEFHQNAQPVATASSVQVRQPLYSSSIGQWRRYGEGSQRAIAELGKHGIRPDDEAAR